MPRWFAALDEGQRRVVAALAALVGALALAIGAVALTDDDPTQANVRTQDATTSSTASSTTSTTTSSSTSTSTTVAGSTPTTKAKAGSGPTTTLRRPGGGTATTRATTTTRPPTVTTDPPSGSEPCATGGGTAGQMAKLFCDHRADLGLPSMVRNGELDAMAQEWAQKMAEDSTHVSSPEQALSHRPSAQARSMVAAACACPGWAENVAFDDTAQEAFNGWLGSTAGHRQHIEDPRDGEYGIGVASGGGYLWFVQVFGYY